MERGRFSQDNVELPYGEILKTQLEYYFSPQNLAQDTFLKSHMNEDRYVSVDLIASFPKVKRLTTDRNLLISVMRECKNLTLDDSAHLVRPNWVSSVRKSERNTIVIRDIPSNLPVEQVMSFFPGKAPANVRSEIGNNWFVTFDNEESCIEAAKGLLEQTHEGNSLKFRVTSASEIFRDGQGSEPSSPGPSPRNGPYPFDRPGRDPYSRPGPAPYSGRPDNNFFCDELSPYDGLRTIPHPSGLSEPLRGFSMEPTTQYLQPATIALGSKRHEPN